MKNKNLYYLLGGVLVIGVVALVAMQLRGSSSLQGYLALPSMPPRSTVGTTNPNPLAPNPVATDSSPNVVADLLPPTVNIITADGQVLTGAQFKVTALVKDDLALAKVEFYVGGSNVDKQTFTSPVPVREFTYNYNVNLSPLTDGVHPLQVRAYDKVGHITESHITFVKQTPHLTVTIPNMGGAKVKESGAIGSIDVDANKELVFRVNLDVAGIDTVKYYVEDVDNKLKPVLVRMVTSPPNPDLFNWVSPVYAWGNHDGLYTWHIYPKAFTPNPSPLKAKSYEQPTPLECFPDPHAASCLYKIKIEGLSKGNVLFAKEITIKVWGPQVWGAMTQGAIYIDVQSIKLIGG